MEIKICGIRRDEDIEIINKYRPEYIGFVFAPSKRNVSAAKAKELASKLNGDTKTVGVFVNAPREEVEKTARDVGLFAVQLHGDEDAEYIKSLSVPCEIWKAVRVNGGDIPDFAGADRILLDKYSDKEYGGSGQTFDWLNVGTLKTDKPVILAGGLNKENVRRGIKIFNPVCVDVSSSVETDGVKDENKIRDFIFKVREFHNE